MPAESKGRGADQTLVFLPGLMCDAAVWRPLMNNWSVGLPMVVAEYGACDALPDMASRVLAAHAGPLHIVGHSMGGRVAMEMMRLEPERLLKVALLGTGYAPLPTGDAGQAERAKRQAFVDTARDHGVRAMAAQWAQGMVASHRLQDSVLMGDIVDMFARRHVEHFEAQIRALLNRPDALPVLKAWNRRAWVIAAELDSWANVDQHRALCEAMPNAQLTVLPGVGHMFPMENPELLAEVLTSWLQEPSSPFP